MFINSWGYIVFLMCAVAMLIVLPKRSWKSSLLLGLNLIACAFLALKQLPILILFCGFSYVFALILRDSERPRAGWFFIYLLVGISVFGFLIKSFWSDFEIRHGMVAGVLVPIGFGYVCLQNLGFVLDSKNREIEAFPSFIEFLASATFFANIVAGPIENLAQLQEKIAASAIDMEQIRAGALRIATGFCKKAFSDVLVSPLFFSESGHWLSNPSLAAIPGLLLKFYADFSGSTDIAIGSAQILGIRLPENFNQPYKSLTMAEYWTRWHISLGNWFKTYFFYPVQKWILARSTGDRAYFAVGASLFLTFLLIGLWHGITWNCFIWGLLNATLVVMSPWLVRRIQNRSKVLNGCLLTATLFFTFLGQLLLVSESMNHFIIHLRRILLEWKGLSTAAILPGIIFIAMSVCLWGLHQYDRRLYQQDCSRPSLRYFVFLGIQVLFTVLFFKSGASFLYADF